jgi:hypothetical protein
MHKPPTPNSTIGTTYDTPRAIIISMIQPLCSTTKSTSPIMKYNAQWNSGVSRKKNKVVEWGILLPHNNKHKTSLLFQHPQTQQLRTWYLYFHSSSFIPSISHVLLRRYQKNIFRPSKNSSMTSQQKTPLLHCHSIASITQNIKFSIFINLQQTNALTHRHISCSTFCHFLFLATRIIFSSIRVSLKKMSTRFHPTYVTTPFYI